MEDQIRRTIFNPRLQELISEIREIVKDNIQYKLGTKQLKEDLEVIVETSFEDLSDMRAVVDQELRYHDFMLGDFTQALAARLISGKYNREYNIVTKCPKCTTSDNKRYRERAKSRQKISVDNYIYEADVIDGSFVPDLISRGFVPECKRGNCSDTLLEITNSANIIMPDQPQPVYLISSRVKTTGRYCHKLVDRIFYELGDELGWKKPEDVTASNLKDGEEEIIVGEKRSLVDRFAFNIIIDFPDGFTEQDFRKMYRELYCVELPRGRGVTKFKQIFKTKYGMQLPQKLSFEDMVCYSMLENVSRNFDVQFGRLDDKILKPKRKMKKGVREEYKMLQFPLHYKGVAFEGQIKLKELYLREQNRKSLFSHYGWTEVGNGLREAFFEEMPEARVVYTVLHNVFDIKMGNI